MASGLPQFPAHDADAESRFQATRSRDPFPEIPSALLNVADLLDYVATTGMVYPFDIPAADPSVRLKPASCAIPLRGKVLFWREEYEETKGRMVATKDSFELGSGQKLQLARNSIVYVTLEPMFRMPDYIAARFNLTIRDIYRGLLVGTGPLVDPGFVGRLSLPLHNLTSNDYELEGGEPLVWMEFTKLSPHKRWSGRTEREGKTWVDFPPRKLSRHDVEDYIGRASPTPITSSIPRLVGQAQESADKSAREARSVRRIFLGVSALGLAAIAAGLAALVISVYGLVGDTDKDRQALSDRVSQLSTQLRDERRDRAAVQRRLDRLTRRVERRLKP